MINREHAVTVKRQAELVGISRGTVYYLPRPMSPADLALMRRIDELHLNKPFLGSRMLPDALNREGVAVGRKHVATLMKRMGHRSAASQAWHEQEASRAYDLSLPASAPRH